MSAFPHLCSHARQSWQRGAGEMLNSEEEGSTSSPCSPRAVSALNQQPSIEHFRAVPAHFPSTAFPHLLPELRCPVPPCSLSSSVSGELAARGAASCATRALGQEERDCTGQSRNPLPALCCLLHHSAPGCSASNVCLTLTNTIFFSRN